MLGTQPSPAPYLHIFEGPEQLQGFEVRLHQRSGVEEGRLLGDVGGRALVQPGQPRDLCSG